MPVLYTHNAPVAATAILKAQGHDKKSVTNPCERTDATNRAVPTVHRATANNTRAETFTV